MSKVKFKKSEHARPKTLSEIMLYLRHKGIASIFILKLSRSGYIFLMSENDKGNKIVWQTSYSRPSQLSNGQWQSYVLFCLQKTEHWKTYAPVEDNRR